MGTSTSGSSTCGSSSSSDTSSSTSSSCSVSRCEGVGRTERGRQGTEREDFSYPTEESSMAGLVSRRSAARVGELGRRSGPQTPKARGPSGTCHLKDTPVRILERIRSKSTKNKEGSALANDQAPASQTTWLRPREVTEERNV